MKKLIFFITLILLSSCEILVSDEDLGCSTCKDLFPEVDTPIISLSGASAQDLEKDVDAINLFINDNNSNSTGTTCTISPDIATNTGLVFNGGNCQISGTPNLLSNSQTYTVTATNDAGKVATIDFTLASHIKDRCLDSAFTAATPFGSGTLSDPYLICTTAQLDVFVRANVGTSSTHFKVMKNIDLTGVTLPLGTLSNNTVFDGNGYTLSNGSLTAADDIGIFTSINNATIRNLVVENTNITGQARIGIIAGSMVSSNLENIFIAASNVLSSTNSSVTSGMVVGTVDNLSRMDFVIARANPNEATGGCIVGNGGFDLTSITHTEVYYEANSACQLNGPGAISRNTAQMNDSSNYSVFPSIWDKVSVPSTLTPNTHQRYYGP